MTNIKNIINSLLVLFKLALESAYYKQTIPSEIDEGIGKILLSLSSIRPSEVGLMSDSITGDNARVLGLYAERMASLAVRENSVKKVKLGLIALLINAQTEDSRDALLVLSLLYDAASKTSDNPKQVFSEAASVIGGEKFLNDFLMRSDEDKSIEAMGYQESSNEEGFLYIRDW